MRCRQGFVQLLSKQTRRNTAVLTVGFVVWFSVIEAMPSSVCRAGENEPVRFSQDFLPILSENCFTCHGPDAKARRADLRLDLNARADRSIERAAIDP
jgi:Planctomycete cytochrome C